MKRYRVIKGFRVGRNRYEAGKPIELGRIQHRALHGRGVVSKEPFDFEEENPGKSKGPSETKPASPGEIKIDESKILDIAWLNSAEEALQEDHGTKIRAALSKVIEGATPNDKEVNKKALKRALDLANAKLSPTKG